MNDFFKWILEGVKSESKINFLCYRHSKHGSRTRDYRVLHYVMHIIHIFQLFNENALR